MGGARAGAGRPSLLNDELAERICDELMEGKSLVKICEAEGMPHRVTVVKWMRNNAEFATKCAYARAEQAELMDDRILDVVGKTESGALSPDAARVVLSGLQWRAAKLKPKVYGEATTLRHEGDVTQRHLIADHQPTVDEWLKKKGIKDKEKP